MKFTILLSLHCPVFWAWTFCSVVSDYCNGSSQLLKETKKQKTFSCLPFPFFFRPDPARTGVADATDCVAGKRTTWNVRPPLVTLKSQLPSLARSQLRHSIPCLQSFPTTLKSQPPSLACSQLRHSIPCLPSFPTRGLSLLRNQSLFIP